MTDERLQQVIDQVSQKTHVISEDALKARATIDKQKHSGNNQKQERLLGEIQQSIHLLLSMFRVSRFDEIVMLMSNPYRLFGLNLGIGIIRGIGFAIGMGAVLMFVAYLLKEDIPGLLSLFEVSKPVQ